MARRDYVTVRQLTNGFRHIQNGWGFVTLYRRQGLRLSPWEKNAKKAKWLSEEALQIAVKRREEKRKDISI